MKVAFYTLGCKVNQYETDLLKDKFEKIGYDIVDFSNRADIYVINTCSVTNMSDRKSRQMINFAKKKNPNSVVCVTGCYTQAIKDKIEEYPNIDIAIGNEQKDEIVDILKECLKEKRKKLIRISDINKVKKYEQKGILDKAYDVRESVKIEDGCNNFCTYCIIPYVRGRIRSRSIEDIVKEVEALVKNNVKEVVLVGIEIASYGKDLENGQNLIDVIEAVAKVPGLERIRLGSIEPRWITDDTVARMKKIDKLCKHFHLSLQSGTTSVLKRMNRKYTAEEFYDIILKLKEAFKDDLCLTTDIIVGFPGETEEEFAETLEFVQKVGFKEVHAFKYSKRDGTVAAKMKDQIDGNVKHDRSQRLIAVSNKLTEKFNQKYIGKKVKVLVEKIEDGYMEGYTDTYIKIRKKVDENWVETGEILELEIENKDIEKKA